VYEACNRRVRSVQGASSVEPRRGCKGGGGAGVARGGEGSAVPAAAAAAAAAVSPDDLEKSIECSSCAYSSGVSVPTYAMLRCADRRQQTSAYVSIRDLEKSIECSSCAYSSAVSGETHRFSSCYVS
jgi:hypothetical protein